MPDDSSPAEATRNQSVDNTALLIPCVSIPDPHVWNGLVGQHDLDTVDCGAPNGRTADKNLYCSIKPPNSLDPRSQRH